MWSSLALSLVVQTMERIRTTTIMTITRTMEIGTTAATMTLPGEDEFILIGGVVAFTDGSTGDVVSGELVTGGSSVVELKMASGEQVEL